MSTTNGVDIEKGTPGANINLGADSTSGLIANAVAVTDKAQLGVVYPIYQPSDAESLGIDAAYDTANNINLYRHISEFYRIAGKGVELHIFLVGMDVSMVQMVEDAGAVYCKKLIAEAKGAIRQMAVCLNPATDYVATYTDGLDSDIRAAIPKAQALAEWGYSTFRPFQVFLEGRDYNAASSAAALNLKAIENTVAEKVSLVIGQDYDYADNLHAICKKFADVGNFLGCVAKMKVNENPGENERMNITNAGLSKFLTAGLSRHVKISGIEEAWETLNTKGYIFPIYYTGLSGLRWNDDHVCAAEVIDEDGFFNENTIAYGRTLDKAARALRAALLPKVKTVQPVDPATGKLPVGIIKYFEGIGDRAFERMENAAEISRGKTTVDPDSDILTGEKALKASFVVVPYGTIKAIKGTINLKTTI